MRITNTELAQQIDSLRELVGTRLEAHQELMLEKLKPLADLKADLVRTNAAVARNTRQINIWRGIGSAIVFIFGAGLTLVAAALHSMKPVVK